MRREKNQVLKDLPEKIIEDVVAELTPIQSELYRFFEQKDIGNVQEGKQIKISFLRILNNLRKILNHPKMLITLVKDRSQADTTQLIYDEFLRSKVSNLNQLKRDYY